MGVYIKGMEMPKPKLTDMATVYNAYVLVSPNGHATIVVDNDDGLDSTEYLLVSAPPHGRLIDADALCDLLMNLADNEYTPKVFASYLSYEENAPTIIPASEDGDT